jgi:hypothetical protein
MTLGHSNEIIHLSLQLIIALMTLDHSNEISIFLYHKGTKILGAPIISFYLVCVYAHMHSHVRASVS